MAKDKNAIGDFGENCAIMRLMKFYIFRGYLIGGKAPVFDILLEINDENKPYQALVQVKSTDDSNPYLTNGNIKTPVPKKKLDLLIKRPLPTYVGGMDNNTETLFIAPAYNPRTKYSSIPPTLKMDNSDLQAYRSAIEKLRDDIINYWETFNMHTNKPIYNSTL